MNSLPLRTALLIGAVFTSVPAFAQDQPTTATAPPAASAAPEPVDAGTTGDDESEDEIVITGARPRGSVVGDIPPEDTLDSRDVRATGATNINELLDAIAPQIGSARGRGGERPVLLLNGQRISSFRELRDVPTEAIERVEILPEEVALKYGYQADQKVVNIVLRQRFRSTVAFAGGTLATDGGHPAGTGDLTKLLIGKNGRTTLNLHAERSGMLTEDERNIVLSGDPPAGATVDDQLAARSLLPSKTDIRAGSTFNRTILGDVSATLNTEVEHQEGRALIGLGDTLLAPLGRDTSSDSAHAGFGLNGTKSGWHWNVTGNADIGHDTTSTRRDETAATHNRATDDSTSADLTATANGNLFKLPAGDVSTTITLAGDTQRLDSHSFVNGKGDSTSLSRTKGQAGISLDVPISRRNRDFSVLGNLTLNANAEVDHYSDFGTLTVIGAGANWSPVERLNFITSWTREEGAPTIDQLGDPLLSTSGTRIFDFVTGETVLVTAITGGNPDLLSDRRNVWKLGANWQPFANTDLRLRADYVHQAIDNPISNISVTESIEAAFPDRFVRTSAGELTSVDLRPVNFDSSQRETLRLGFDFSKPLKSRRPSQSVIDQIRAQFGGGRTRPGENATPGGAAPAGNAPSPGGDAAPSANSGPPPEGGGRYGGGAGGGGRGGGGGFFGGGSRGRLTFSLTDSIALVDKVRIAPGVPELDYLHGDAAGSAGGTPRHTVQAQLGWANNGLGARIGANWRSGTNVDTLSGDDLRFSPLGTVDLRLFAQPGDIPEIAIKHPWLRGTQLRIEATNIFNSRPAVHDSAGNVPLNYQPDLLDPLGRTIMISFRKSFLPSPSWFRQQRDRDAAQQTR